MPGMRILKFKMYVGNHAKNVDTCDSSKEIKFYRNRVRRTKYNIFDTRIGKQFCLKWVRDTGEKDCELMHPRRKYQQ
jgi:hypothetical protein